MRYLGILLLAASSLAAQPAENDPRILQTLLSEVQQLRFAIERSTLLGTRTQLAISQLQLQEGKAERLSKELATLRDEMSRFATVKARLAEELKDSEAARTLPRFTPPEQRAIEGRIKEIKLEQEGLAASEQHTTAREGELASQLQAAQREVQDSRNWIAEMQRSLDAAIQQTLKPR